MKIAVIVLNKDAARTAVVIADYLTLVDRHINGTPEDCSVDILENTEPGGLPKIVADAFGSYEGIIFITASGIAVRMIAPHIKNKYSDPAVVVLDGACRFAVSLLSGHEGGANDLAYLCAAAVGAVPVVGTGTETNKPLTLGIGCRKGVSPQAVREAVFKGCESAGIDSEAVRCAASIDIKKYEPGLIKACRELQLPLRYFSASEINSYCGEYTENEVSLRNLDVRGVAEPCALLAGRNPRLILTKKVFGDVTIAAAIEQIEKGKK